MFAKRVAFLVKDYVQRRKNNKKEKLAYISVLSKMLSSERIINVSTEEFRK